VDHEDEQLKALFTTAGEQPGPPLGFTADGIVRRGRRVRMTRWAAGAAASLVVAGALTTTIALTANRDERPGGPAPAPQLTTTDAPATTPETTTTTTTPTTTGYPTTEHTEVTTS
jgi:hypothetical protein